MTKTPFLQGLTKAFDMMEHDLEEGAKDLTTKISSVGSRGKAAFVKGQQRIDGVVSKVAEVEKFVTALEGSNGGDPLDNSSTTSEASTGTPPEQLTVNGVSKS
jgi:hypothetical protein